MNELYVMGMITNRGIRNKMIPFFKENHIHVTLSTMGVGTANSAILDYLGMEATEKTIYFAFVTMETWKAFKKELYSKMKIDIAGRGIAFLIPMSSIGGKKALQYITMEQEVVVEEESTLKETKYELLVVIANQGYTDLIMDAARKAHAPGGTVIHAKGTGAEKAEKFLGVSIAVEKEMIFMVTRREGKNAIMKAIMEQAGLESEARAIVFSLPVTETAGMRLIEDEEKA